MKIDIYRSLVIVISVIGGVVGFVYGQPLIHGNSNAVNIIVTVFSILAGFLIAVMTIVGEHSLLPGNWRIAELQRDTILRENIRYMALFYVYLLALGLIFTSSLIEKDFPKTNVWIEKIYCGISFMGFLLSIGLPKTLKDIQKKRHDAVIKLRRDKAGIGN